MLYNKNAFFVVFMTLTKVQINKIYNSDINCFVK